MSNVFLENVSKMFPDGTIAVDQVSLEVNDREFLVLVGPSGCGKSTTLRLIAGLEAMTDGNIAIGDRVVNDVAPKDRDIAMVFQNYALYPHMSVYNNLSFGLRLRYGGGFFARVLRRLFKPGRAMELEQLRRGIDQQVRQTAARLGIDHLLNRKPHQLSGGERQRVALGRAIVRNPAAFLFDEPLSNLDAKLRGQMRIELRRLHRELGATMIYVTHDQIEAMTLGDRVAVMNGGRILQVDHPLSLYQRPVDLFVARFMGSVPINLQAGTIVQRNGAICFESSRINVELEKGVSPVIRLAGDVVIGFRSEDVQIVGDEDSACHFSGQVVAIDRLGDAAHLHLSVDQHGGRVEPDDAKSSDAIVVRAAADTRIGEGDRIRLRIETSRILWFDAGSGENLLRDCS